MLAQRMYIVRLESTATDVTRKDLKPFSSTISEWPRGHAAIGESEHMRWLGGSEIERNIRRD